MRADTTFETISTFLSHEFPQRMPRIFNNATSASSPEQKWIAAEAMYRWFATTTLRVAQALNREIINGALAYRVTFADGGSAAYQILQVIPTPISPSLSESPIPNTETAGTGSPAPGAVC